MAAPTYPGDVTNGDTLDEDFFNDRLQPLWKIANPGMSGGTGVTDDQINDGQLSAAKISGTAMTRSATETVTGDKTFSGDVDLDGTTTQNGVLIRPRTTNTSGDATPSVAGITHLSLTAGTTAVTSFDDGVTDQVLIVSGDGTITIEHGTGNIQLDGGANKPAIAHPSVFIFDGTNWYEHGTF